MTEILGVHQALADPTRLRIVRLLLQGELCVCEIMAALQEPQYKVSRHLAVLKAAGLLRDRRVGTRVHYALAPELAPAWRAALTALAGVWDACPEVATVVDRLCTMGEGGTGARV